MSTPTASAVSTEWRAAEHAPSSLQMRLLRKTGPRTNLEGDLETWERDEALEVTGFGSQARRRFSREACALEVRALSGITKDVARRQSPQLVQISPKSP